MKTAFTMIEMLAVVILIGLAAIMVTPMLVGSADASKADAALSRMLDLDARARLVAMGSGASTVRYQDQRWTLLNTAGQGEAEPLTSWNPEAVTITLETDDSETIESIRYNAAGRSIDFNVTVEYDGLVRRATIAGLTGWVTKDGTP